jgi:hypothetical protein
MVQSSPVFSIRFAFPRLLYLLLWLMFFAWQLVQCVEMQALGSVKEGLKQAIGRASFANDFACIARKGSLRGPDSR